MFRNVLLCLFLCLATRASGEDVSRVIEAHTAQDLNWGISYWLIAYDKPDESGMNIPFVAQGLSTLGVPVNVVIDGEADLFAVSHEDFYLRFSPYSTDVWVDDSQSLEDWRGFNREDLRYIYKDEQVVNEILEEAAEREQYTPEEAALAYAEMDINHYAQNKLEFKKWHYDYYGGGD